MKKVIVTIGILIALSFGGSSFCSGWSAGYIAGHCYGKGYSCLEPLVPLCPLARLGEDHFEGGYNRGFLRGLASQN